MVRPPPPHIGTSRPRRGSGGCARTLRRGGAGRPRGALPRRRLTRPRAEAWAGGRSGGGARRDSAPPPPRSPGARRGARRAGTRAPAPPPPGAWRPLGSLSPP